MEATDRPGRVQGECGRRSIPGDLSRAPREMDMPGPHTDSITAVLIMAASDAEYAAGQAVDDLRHALN